MASTLGADFAAAMAAKDYERAASLLDPDVDFRGLTPNQVWEASSPQQVVDEILTGWFTESDHVEELFGVESGSVSDREHVAYRFRGHNDDGPFVVEQQAYFTERNGRIDWIRVLCSGFRPAP